MKKETEEKLARSLTAETTALLPFLPYLLQDFWALGSNPAQMTALIKKHIPPAATLRVLDMACGKGAVSVAIARECNAAVVGYDLLPEFIAYAKEKAAALSVAALCRFETGDANEAAATENGYDAVIFGAAGNILGNPAETLLKLRQTIRPGGFVLIDEAYLSEGADNEDVKYKNFEYLTRAQWLYLFQESGLRLIEEIVNKEEDGYNFDADNKAITARANELIEKYPEKRAMFEGYIESQLNECADLEGAVTGVTWLLQAVDETRSRCGASCTDSRKRRF